MDIDTNRVRQLLDKRDEIDAELLAVFSGQQTKKPVRCSSCGELSHTARTCPRKEMVAHPQT